MNCESCGKEMGHFDGTFFPEFPEHPLCHSCTFAKFLGGSVDLSPDTGIMIRVESSTQRSDIASEEEGA